MSLKTYWKKREFTKTKEPKGKLEKVSKSRFVVQEHHASHLHWDFRLELSDSPGEGEIVLKSWAVPKGPPQKKTEKRLAVQTEDHPLDYINFSGNIPKGQYGAGVVKIWDRGTFDLLKREENSIEFVVYGKKLKGNYSLVKFQPPKNWLLIKKS